MTKKLISMDAYASLMDEACKRAESARGSRQRIKMQHSTLRSLLDTAPALAYVTPEDATHAVIIRTGNLGTKKWPDTYKKIELCPLQRCKVTEKRISWGTGKGSEYANVDNILCFVKEELEP